MGGGGPILFQLLPATKHELKLPPNHINILSGEPSLLSVRFANEILPNWNHLLDCLCPNNSRLLLTVTEVAKWMRNSEPQQLKLFRRHSRQRTEKSGEFFNELSMNRRKQHEMLLPSLLVLVLLLVVTRCYWRTSRWFLLLSPPMMLGNQLCYLDH
jgi:hypothetical protein